VPDGGTGYGTGVTTVHNERSDLMAMPTDETKTTDVDSIKDDIQKLRDDIGTLLSHIGSFGKGKLGSTREKLGAKAEAVEERAYDRVRGTTRSARERGWQAVRSSRDKVQDRPLTYLTAAFVAGMIFASIFEWKRS
jgi:ElaB/YqjD/DUF883 family membrane-anchored ribosome-binding protein